MIRPASYRRTSITLKQVLGYLDRGEDSEQIQLPRKPDARSHTVEERDHGTLGGMHMPPRPPSSTIPDGTRFETRRSIRLEDQRYSVRLAQPDSVAASQVGRTTPENLRKQTRSSQISRGSRIPHQRERGLLAYSKRQIAPLPGHLQDRIKTWLARVAPPDLSPHVPPHLRHG